MYARLEVVSRKLQWTGVKHLSAQEPMLDRIAGNQTGFGLWPLANSVDATGIDDRAPARKYTSLVPLNRLVDAASAESEWVRALVADARSVLTAPGVDRPAEQRLRAAFAIWKSLPGAVTPIAAQSDMGVELVPVAETLSRLGKAGEKALDCIVTHQAPTAGWVDAQKPLLDDATKVTAEVRISGGEVVRVLLEAFGKNGSTAPVVTGSASH